MRIRHLGCIATAAAFFASTAVAAGKCQLQQLGVLPVDMEGLRPFVSAKIDGAKARFLLDSGGFYSTISREAAEQYHLPLTSMRNDTVYLEGVGGGISAQLAIAKDFEFLGMPLHKIPFLVIDQSMGSDTAGIIGQNVLRVSDVEYDFADGTVRFFNPVGCESQPLAYWAVKTPYSFVKLRPMYASEPHLSSTVMINGRSVTVWFDTGASRSMLSLEAAKRIGITPNSPGVTFLGVGYGIGASPVKTWVAPIDTFQIGGEKVAHTHLMIGDLQARDSEGLADRDFPDLILGDDFFLSHRIYVAYGQNTLYFTYNGGPLFNLNLLGYASAAGTGAQPAGDTPTDAAGFRRRGMAYAAMREFDRAIADLTRACELAPSDAGNRYQRGVIYAEDGQFKSALQDFDASITSQPDDIDAHMARAELLQAHPDSDPAAATAEIKSDLDAASRLAPPDSSLRLTLSDLYNKAGDYSAALGQVDQWLDNHRLRSEQIAGLNSRCWLRATANRDLHAALDDCDQALALRPQAPPDSGSLIVNTAPEDPAVLDSRGLVYLRLGNLKGAIRDYDSALQIDANMSTALYARGLAELREGRKTQGQADLAAAEKLDSGIARLFASMGLAP
ncbi:MAG: tetratricopeptide repeat protein [Gammaproteobacteria bacterium]|nr:tetratricopeptide repeat protein [Gammaproteobacteria bacterium]